MSNLVRSSLQYPVASVRIVKGIAAIAINNPRETAIETPWTALAGFVAGIAPLLFSNYHSIIFSIVMPSKNMRRST